MSTDLEELPADAQAPEKPVLDAKAIRLNKEACKQACRPLHRKFCELYVKYYTESKGRTPVKCRERSARECGYSEKNIYHHAWLLMRRPEIVDYIDVLLDDATRRADVDSSWVLDRLCIEAEDHGKGTTQAARVRALELIGKAKGMFADEKPNVVVPIKVFIGINPDDV